ncbi:hypothetical protein [Soonwooa sp.]|uniref:hypothetical protein n=1 Tax=Soonwooa sp. TaxID=1938592 RepID=UPI00261FDB11|nr:hypothetical protein [Soonwooa sp.]
MVETQIAINIETSKFFAIVEHLQKSSWRLCSEYSQIIFDKGIDFDFYQFKKDKKEILMAWSNWFEGEIKSSPQILENLSKEFDFKLNFGEAEYLNNDNIIEEMKAVLSFY